MFRIKAKNLTAFEQQAADTYLAELLQHCRLFAPQLSQALTDTELRTAVQDGMVRARAHGFDQRGTVRFYVDVMIVLGSDFDTDPQFPWAAEILADEGYRTPMDRAEALHARLLAHVAEVDGRDNVHAREALADLAALVRRGAPLYRDSFEDDVLRLLAQIHPRKVEVSGEAAIRRLIAAGIARTERQELRHALPTIALMVAFGHRFDADPWLPWIARAVRERNSITSEQATEWLERVLGWLGPPPRQGEGGR